MNYPAIRATRTRMVALAVDPPEKSAILVRELELPFDLLCDVDRRVVAAYHLLHEHERGEIAYPAVFVINSDGEIVFRSLDEKSRRVNLAELLSFLQRLQKDPTHRKEGKRRKWIFPSIKQELRNRGILPNPYF